MTKAISPPIIQFFNSHKLLFRNLDKWRIVPDDDQRWGNINGLPNFRGKLICSDGILCALENEDGQIHVGHVDWFIPEKKTNKGYHRKSGSKLVTELFGILR